MTPLGTSVVRKRASRRAVANRVAGLFDQHASMVLGLCRILLRDHHEAEDAAQQTFVSAYRSLLRGTEPREPAPWLAAIARNECRARIRKRMRAPLALDHEVEETLADTADLAELADRRTEFAAVTAAIAELPTRQREAVALRDFLGLSYEEVAATLSVSVPVVESLLFRARRRLRDTVRTAPRYAASIVVVPFALRAAVAREIPDFDGGGGGLGVAGAAVAAASAGAAKLISLPFAAKAVTAVTVVAAATVGPQLGGMIGKAPGPAKTPAAISAPAGNGSAAAPSAPASGASTAVGPAAPADESAQATVATSPESKPSDVVEAAVSSGSASSHHQKPQKKHSAPAEPDRNVVGAGAGSPGVDEPPPVDPGDGSAPSEPGAGVQGGVSGALPPPPAPATPGEATTTPDQPVSPGSPEPSDGESQPPPADTGTAAPDGP